MDLNTSSPSLCAKGCGFYGSAETNNFCSKCYKDYLKEHLSKSSQAPATPQTLNPTASSTAQSSSTIITSETVSSTSGFGSLRVKNRCQCCNKKVGLTGFGCRCGNMFCGVHRYPKEHECTFDFKGADRGILVKENPVVRGDKLEWRV